MTSRQPANENRAPKVPRKPQQRGLLRLRQLLDAASALFIRQGVEATTIDEIVALAGVAKGTFYHHFASKADLLHSLREDFIASYTDRVIHSIENCPPDALCLRLNCWIHAAIEAYIDMSALHEIIFSGPDEPMRWTASGCPLMDHLLDLLKEGNARSIWQAVYPHTLGTLLFRGMLGVLEDKILRGEDPRSACPEVSLLAARLLALPDPLPQLEKHPPS